MIAELVEDMSLLAIDVERSRAVDILKARCACGLRG